MNCVRIDVANGLATAGNNTFPIHADSPDLLHLEGGTCLHAISYEARQELLEAASLASEPSATLRETLRKAATLHLGRDDVHLVEVIALALAGADQDQPIPPFSAAQLAVEHQLSVEALVALPAYRVDQLALSLTPAAEDPWHQIVFPYANLTTLESLAHYLAEQLLTSTSASLPTEPNAPSPPSSVKNGSLPTKLPFPEPGINPVSNGQIQASAPILASSGDRVDPTIPDRVIPANDNPSSGIRASAFTEPLGTTQKDPQASAERPASSSILTTGHPASPATSDPSSVRDAISSGSPFNDTSLAMALDHLTLSSQPTIALPPPPRLTNDPVLDSLDLSPFDSSSNTGSSWAQTGLKEKPAESNLFILHRTKSQKQNGFSTKARAMKAEGIRPSTPSFPQEKQPQVETLPSMDAEELADQLADLLELEADLRGYLP